MARRLRVRGARHTGATERLPVEHAPGPMGGALCGARRKWGVLLAQSVEGVTCRTCNTWPELVANAFGKGTS